MCIKRIILHLVNHRIVNLIKSERGKNKIDIKVDLQLHILLISSSCQCTLPFAALNFALLLLNADRGRKKKKKDTEHDKQSTFQFVYQFCGKPVLAPNNYVSTTTTTTMFSTWSHQILRHHIRFLFLRTFDRFH